MSRVFRLPDLGEGLQQAEIVAWHVGVGDRVVTDQPLVSVETDKALVEIPCPHSGYVAALHGRPGDVVIVGATLVEFGNGRAHDPGAIVGQVIAAPDAPPAACNPAVAPAAPTPARAAPAVRQLAATLGVGLADVQATGVDGTITRADVERTAAGTAQPERRMRGVRRAMLDTMTRAGREVVPATLTDEADIDAWAADADLTVRLIRALVAGCSASPALNAWLAPGTCSLTLQTRIDLGLAMETDAGLFTPVLRNVAQRSAAQLRAEIETLKAALARRDLAHEHLTGQTITLSNFGRFGGRHAQMIVVPPQVAILGAGRAARRPVVAGDRLVAHRVLPLSLTIDHRAVTGAEAARFLSAVIQDLETPG